MSKRKICTNDPKKYIYTKWIHVYVYKYLCCNISHSVFFFLLFFISYFIATLCCLETLSFWNSIRFTLSHFIFIVTGFYFIFASMLHSIQNTFPNRIFRLFRLFRIKLNTQTKICNALIEIISDSMFSNFFRQIMYSSHSVFIYASE